MRILVSALALTAAVPATAQSFTGPAIAIDGDTLDMSGARIRLFGIDAPEGVQTCNRKGVKWACGGDARALLSEMVSGRTIECAQRDRDHYGRVVAVCRAGGSDLADVMVREGLAIALTRFSDAYSEAEARAKSFGMALWGSEFQTPAEFRAANPALFPSAPQSAAAPTASYREPPSPRQARYAGGAFRNCAEARARGATPLRRGQPGYGAHMDGDGDGIACERG